MLEDLVLVFLYYVEKFVGFRFWVSVGSVLFVEVVVLVVFGVFVFWVLRLLRSVFVWEVF